MSRERDYPVGYGKPPEHTRFKKGRTGNPRGRPRRAKNLATLLGAALDGKVTVTEHGRRRTITKREAMIAQLVNRSAQAGLKAMAIVLGMMQENEPVSYGKIQGIARFCRQSSSIRDAGTQGFRGFRDQIPYASEQGIFEPYQ
jgi:hypothetical protein